jgi:uncharacterized protein (TIGR03437 family)
MRFSRMTPARRAIMSLGSLAVLLSFFLPPLEAANIGTVVPVIGVVADLVYDSARNVVYLANFTRNEVDIYSASNKALTGSIPTGLQPASLALSPDLNTLYVANIGSNTISSINLNTGQPGLNFMVGSRPDAIAVGNDGQILILSAVGTFGLQRLNPVTGLTMSVPIAPPPTAAPGLPTINPSPTPAGFLAGLITTASGNLIIGLSNTRLFVYEVSSGVVLRSRNVSGLRSIMSASTDGSRFMAGPFLFDTQTLTILGRAGTLPTALNATFTGGSAFSIDGNSVYATFSTQPPINPLNPNNPQTTPSTPTITPTPTPPLTTSILQVMRASSLTPQLGLRLPENITSKVIASPDGQNLFATSTSGLTVIPIGQLQNLPILDVSSTNVVLSTDTCNRTIATATVQIRNLGSGRMNFSAGVSSGNSPIILNQRSGSAPGTLTITFSPRPTPGTSLVRGTQQYVVTLSSQEAINVEPAILVNFNYRDVSDRGTIVPLNGVGVDMQMDAARQRLYIANYTQDQIEVFSLATQTFLPPIRVGNRPLSMAMANPSTLVVANWGSENLSVVDLDAMQEVQEIQMGPVPLTATPLFPRYIAASSNAILFSAVPLPATLGALSPAGSSIWQLSLLTGTAFPRLDLGTGVPNNIGAHNVLTASGDGSGILIADAPTTNIPNLRFYDPIADTFTILRAAGTNNVTGFRGAVAAAPDGSSFVVDNFVFNSALGFQGSVGALTFGSAIGNGNVVRVQNLVTTVTPNTIPTTTVQALQRFSLSTLQQNLQMGLPEQVMDISPSNIGLTTGIPRQWPPRSVALEIGVTGQTQILPHGVIADSSNNVYLLSFSGFSIVSLGSSTGRGPSFASSGVVNTASRKPRFAPGSLITILGSNLADTATASGNPLPQILGGVCVTANEVSLPLISTSPTEIDAQLPTEFGTGSVTLTVRSTALGQSSGSVRIALDKTGPGVFSVDGGGGLQVAAIIHSADFALVTPDYPAERDETVILYTTGLGPVDPSVASGQQAPWDPFAAATETVQVTIGGTPYPVLWSGLSPYMVGIYQINLYVPGDHVQGDSLPVIVTAGGISSATDTAPGTSVH